MSETLQLATDLISRASVTPEDAGCQALLAERLTAMGFEVEHLPAGGVSNLWARRGIEAPLLVFAGHTDVVPAGPESLWHSPPFRPEIREGRLYGRGAADMKGSLAAMVTACERFVAAHPDHPGSIAFLITSDEEGDAEHGTRHVIEQLTARDEKIDWCVVGEPSSHQRLGDTIRHGRRGSLSGQLRVIGKQGHVAYPELAINPVHAALDALNALCSEEWDRGNAHFPPTSFQISNIHAGTGTTNVIPGELAVDFNFRFSPESSAETLRQKTECILASRGLNYRLQWHLSGEPFITPRGELIEAAHEVVHEITGRGPEFSTGGGTSDGRFIAPTGAQVIELGPRNSSIHQVNEWVDIGELEQLNLIHERLLQRLLL